MNKRKKLELQYDYLKYLYSTQNDYRTYRQMWLLSMVILFFTITNLVINPVDYIFLIIALVVLISFVGLAIYENYHQTNDIADTKKKLQEIYSKLSK